MNVERPHCIGGRNKDVVVVLLENLLLNCICTLDRLPRLNILFYLYLLLIIDMILKSLFMIPFTCRMYTSSFHKSWPLANYEHTSAHADFNVT
jgi:hypothetical protein